MTERFVDREVGGGLLFHCSCISSLGQLHQLLMLILLLWPSLRASLLSDGVYSKDGKLDLCEKYRHEDKTELQFYIYIERERERKGGERAGLMTIFHVFHGCGGMGKIEEIVE